MWRLFALMVVLIGVAYSSASEKNGTFGENVDGSGLIKLGRKLHKPMLTLIGMVIHNLHPCGEWTPWSPCDATERGYFGSQTRTRACADIDHSDTKEKPTELESKLCEGKGQSGDLPVCPESYNRTSHGFCIKLNTTKVTNDKAMEQCKQEGGYLIHIDSQTKYDDVKSLLSGYSYANIYIDGRRKDSSSPWEYQYGSKSAFLKWHSSYPRNGPGDLCLLYSTSHAQADYRCSYSSPFLCEITNV